MTSTSPRLLAVLFGVSLSLACGGKQGEAEDASSATEESQEDSAPDASSGGEEEEDGATVERKRADDYPGLW